MTPQRFAAKTTREALAAARRALGDDALVLASRDHALGVELVACRAAALDADSHDPGGHDPHGHHPGGHDATAHDGAASLPHRVLAELGRLRGLLQTQLAGFAWSDARRRDPRRVALMQTLFAAGFGGALTRGLAARLPRGSTPGGAARWLRQALIRSLPLAGGGLFEHGRVALVGATGAGKTTTLAKLAAQAVKKLGASEVALVAADTYRMAATEQLAAYATLLGVRLYTLPHPDALAQTLAGIPARLILIDTAGFNPLDPRAEALANLDTLGVRRVLVLSAAQQAAALALAMTRLGTGVSAAIISKLDEAPQPGAVLDCLIRHSLPLAAITTGQRVPEDLHAPNATYLVERALRGAQVSSPFTLAVEDWALWDGALRDQAEATRESAREAATQRVA